MSQVYKYNYYFFNLLIIIIWIITFITLLGINLVNEKYINNITFFIHIYICIFLIIRFNPIYTFGDNEFTILDRKIAFSSALTILTTQTNIINFTSNLIKKYLFK
jgi:hypothetical protein